VRIAVIAGHHLRWDKYAWVAAALERTGHEVRRAMFGDEVTAAERWADVSVWEPKWLQNHVGPSGCFRVGWMFDLIARQDGPLAEQRLLFGWDGQRMAETALLRGLKSCDLALVKERSLLDEYRGLGVNAEWFDQGCPHWIGECEHREPPRWDALVLGTTRWRQRREDVAALVAAGLRVGWAVQEGDYGHVGGVEYVPFVPPERLPELASEAAVVVDCGARSDLPGYWSDKFWLVLGMGACHVRRWSPGLPRDPAESPTYLTYGDARQLAAIVGEAPLRTSAEDRKQMGKRAREWVLSNHTYTHRARELVRLCETRMRSADTATATA